MAKIYPILFILLLLISCKKDQTPSSYSLKATFNGNEVTLDNLGGNIIDCSLQSFCPYPSQGKCTQVYSSRLLSNSQNWEVLVAYRVIKDSALLKPENGQWIHQEFDSIRAFDVQSVMFADSALAQGVTIDITNLITNQRYSTSPYPHGTINSDARFSFNFTEKGQRTSNNFEMAYQPTYLINTKGTFNAVLYDGLGDSLVVEDAVFELLFCE